MKELAEKSAEQFGREMVQTLQLGVLETLGAEVIRAYANAEYDQKDDAIKNDIVSTVVDGALGSMLQDYLGVKFSDLSQIQQHLTRERFREVVDMATNEVNDVLLETPGVTEHNSRLDHKITSLRQFTMMPEGLRGEFLRNLQNRGMYQAKGDLEKSLGDFKAPKFQRNFWDLVQDFFKNLSEFFAKSSDKDAKLTKIISAADTNVGKRFSGLTAADACKAATIAALLNKVSDQITPFGFANASLKPHITKDLAVRAGVKLKSLGRKI